MKSCIVIVLFSFVSYHNFFAQTQPRNVAKTGNIPISDDELKFRYELSPMVVQDKSLDEDSLKYVFLYSLIAEKLWAMEAIDKGLNTGERFKFYFNPVKKAIVRDKLFEVEIKNKVKVTVEDINKGVKKYLRIPKVEVLSFLDSAEAYHSYKELIKLGSIDSLIKLDTTLSANVSTFETPFTTFRDEAVEDKIFNLRPKQFTEPLKNENAWFIFQVESIKPSQVSDSQEKILEDVKELIRNRRIKNLYEKYFADVFSSYSIRADEKLFTTLANTVFDVLKADLESESQQPDSQKIYLTEGDYNRIKRALGEKTLDSKLFSTKYGEITLSNFLSDLTLITVAFPELSMNAVNKVLSNNLKTIMQQETLYLIGVKKGLDKSAAVISQLAQWKDNLLAQIMKNTFNLEVTVSEDEIRRFYTSLINDSSSITNYKYTKISSDNIEIIEKIFNMLAMGNDLEKIKNYFNNPDSVSIITTDEISNPIIDKIKSRLYVSELSKNNWYGPIKFDESFVLVKILDIEEVSDSIKNSFASMKDQIKSRLYFKELDHLLEEETVKLANKFGVTVNTGELNDIKLSNMKMFVVRYLGFGGRIATVPVTVPFYKWYYKWTSETRVNP